MSTTTDSGIVTEVDLTVDLGRGLVLANPLMVASGTFGYGVEYGDVVDVNRLGAICSKGTTLHSRVGNPPPRVTETPAGMLNSIGLQNPGVEAVLEKYADRWASWTVPVIVNVAGESVEDYVEVARAARRPARCEPASSSISRAPTWAPAASSSRSMPAPRARSPPPCAGPRTCR